MQKNSAYRLVIDTNLWISFIISKKFSEIETLLYNTQSKLLFSSELIDEIGTTIQKPKLRKYFGTNALDEMLDVFDDYIEFIEVKSEIAICRDHRDNFLLALAKDGKADFLLTGDQDLLVLNPFKKTKIISFSDFSKILNE